MRYILYHIDTVGTLIAETDISIEIGVFVP